MLLLVVLVPIHLVYSDKWRYSQPINHNIRLNPYTYHYGKVAGIIHTKQLFIE